MICYFAFVFTSTRIFFGSFPQLGAVVAAPTVSAREILLQGLRLYQSGQVDEAIHLYNRAARMRPPPADAYHLLGVAYHSMGKAQEAETSVRRALFLQPQNANYHNTLGEILRLTNPPRLEQAMIHVNKALKLANASRDEAKSSGRIAEEELHNNRGLIFLQQQNFKAATRAFQRTLEMNPEHFLAFHNLGLSLRSEGRIAESISAFESILSRGKGDADTMFHLAISLQMGGDLARARLWYEKLLADGLLTDQNVLQAVQVNLGAIFQESGDFHSAIHYYRQVLTVNPNDSRALNNIGSSLWQLGDGESAVDAYRKAITLEPSSSEPHVNLGTAYYEYGDMASARKEYTTALELGGSQGLRVRIALLMKPIMESISNINETRARFKKSISLLIQEAKSGKLHISEPIKDIERLHFYLLYHGLNEYENQVMMARLYLSSSPHLVWVAPSLNSKLDSEESKVLQKKNMPHEKIKVGFISKFFVVNHAHGQLLEGIATYLPQDQFQVYVLAIPNPQNTVLRSMQKGAEASGGGLVRLSFSLVEARRQIENLGLDILILGDVMSEPLTYFLSLGTRVAPVQCLFWGNPVTSGAANIDYFISGEHMEPDTDVEAEWANQYSEQVVRLRGQGIWYDRVPVPDPTLYPPSEPWDWHSPKSVVYICPQSSFKLHPHFDVAVAKILRRVPHGHIVFLDARRPQWTRLMQERMQNHTMIDVYAEGRVHFVPRVAGSDAFVLLLQRADIMLHPFPFGGSKTSADGIAVGLPVVTLTTKSLRGRMAYSFFKTMNIFDTIAFDVDEYVDIASRLGNDANWRHQVRHRIQMKSHLIWERFEVVDAWARFLKRAHLQYEQEHHHSPSTRAAQKQHGKYSHRNQEKRASRYHAIEVPSQKQHDEDAAVQADDAHVKHLLEKARDWFYSGDVKRSQSAYESVLKMRPNDAGIWNDFGAVLKQANKLNQSKLAFQQAVEAAPEYALAYNNLAVVLQELKEYEEAGNAYTKSLELDPGNSGAVYNLGNLYRDIGQYDKAIRMLLNVLGLAAINGGESVALLSLLDLSDASEHVRSWTELEFELKRATLLSDQVSLLSESERIQHKYLDSANSLIKFISRDDDNLPFRARRLYMRLNQLMETFSGESQEKGLASDESILRSEFHIVTQWFRAIGSPARQREINECLLKNLKNPSVTRVHVIVESHNSYYFDEEMEKIGLKNLFSNKLVKSLQEKRLTFDAAFHYLNNHVPLGSICAVTNADIYFDNSLSAVFGNLRRDTVYALLRWDALPDGTAVLRPRIDSQDTWIFHTPVRIANDKEMDFEIGRLRSDNRIAATFMEVVNYRVVNNPLHIKTFHLQNETDRPGRTNAEQIPGRFSMLRIRLGW